MLLARFFFIRCGNDLFPLASCTQIFRDPKTHAGMCPQRRSQMWAFATILMAVVALTSGEAAVAGGSSLSPDASESCVAGDDTCAGEQALLAADQDPTPDSAHKHNTNTAVSGSEGADPDAAKSDAVEPDAESSVLSWRLVSVVIVTGILGLAYVAGAFAKSSATVAVAREYWRFQTLDLNVTVTRFHKDSDKHMYLFFRFIADEDCASMLRAEEDMPKVPASDLGAVEQPVVAEKRTKLGNNRVRVERLLEVPLTWSTMAAGATSPGKSESHDEASTDAVLEVTVPADRASVCLSDAPATVRVGFLFGSEPIHIDSINNDTLQLCVRLVVPLLRHRATPCNVAAYPPSNCFHVVLARHVTAAPRAAQRLYVAIIYRNYRCTPTMRTRKLCSLIRRACPNNLRWSATFVATTTL